MPWSCAWWGPPLPDSFEVYANQDVSEGGLLGAAQGMITDTRPAFLAQVPSHQKLLLGRLQDQEGQEDRHRLTDTNSVWHQVNHIPLGVTAAAHLTD